MSSLKERSLLPRSIASGASPGSVSVITDLTTIDLGDVGAGDTFTVTPTRVDTNTAGSATGAITWDAVNATTAANAQVAIRALGGIYGDATVTAGAAELYEIRVFGGYDVTWAVTPTGFTPGATVETTPGGVKYSKEIPIGKVAVVKKIVAKGFTDNALNVSVVDEDGKNVFVATIDTETTGADVPYIKLLTADGVAGEDGAAAANTNGGLFTGPLTASVTLSAPIGAKNPRLTLVIETFNSDTKRMLERTRVASALSGTLALGAAIAKIRRIALLASADTTVAPTLTDADGLVVYTKTSTNYTTEVKEQLSHEGVDQAGNALADVVDVVAKSPLTLSGTGLDSGTFRVKVWVEV